MANPQVEDGHVDIALEIMDALARTRIPGEPRQILDFIVRKTYGWHKKEDWISLSQFVDGTGINKGHVCRGIGVLLKMNLITQKGKGEMPVTQKGNAIMSSYGFQKDYENWKPLPKKATLPKKAKTVPQKGKGGYPKKATTKENYTKETPKEKYAAFFEIFWKNYPPRNGKKVEKAESFNRYCRLEEGDMGLINQAARNYAVSELVISGIGVRDPKRFIRDGKGNEPWRDWIEPESKGAEGEDWKERWKNPNS